MQTNTRKNKLVPTKQNSPQDAQASRVVTVREISRMKIRVPHNLAETDSALMIAVNPDGQLVPGLVNRRDVPRMYPVDDLNRLISARAVVSSIESTLSKNSAIDDLKSSLVGLLYSYSVAEKDIIVRNSTQSELMQIRPKVTYLRENEEAFRKNKLDESEYRTQIQTWFSQAFLACEKFVVGIVTGRDDKLGDLLTYFGVPKWFFDKVTTAKHVELSQVSSYNTLFPKKLSKMISFTVGELESSDFLRVQSLFVDRIIICQRYLALHPEGNKKSLIYPIPYDFSACFRDFTDLPKLNRTDSKVTLLSVAIVHTIFAAFEPKMISVENLSEHFLQLSTRKVSHVLDLGLLSSVQAKDLGSPIKDLKLNALLVEHLIQSAAELVELQEDQVPKEVPVHDLIEALIAENRDCFQFDDNKLIVIAPKVHAPVIDPESSRNIKSQYLDAVKQIEITAFHRSPELFKTFGLSVNEIDIVPPYIPSMPDIHQKKEEKKKKPVPSSTLFLVGKLPEERKIELLYKKLELIKPIEPKARNRGNPNSVLGKEGQRFMDLLAKAHAHPTFMENVRSYLTLFHFSSFQDQAVKIMEASLKLKEVVSFFTEEEALASVYRQEDEPDPDENEENPLKGFV